MQLSTQTQKQLKQVVFATFIFAFLAHGYRFFNPLFSHDSFQVYIGNDSAWQVSLGRFMHLPYWAFVRGYVTAPWLVGMLALLFMTLAHFLIAKMIDLKKGASITLLCGILVTSPIWSLLAATYMHEWDLYACSFLLATLAVFVWQKYRFGFLLSTLLIFCSVGFYQCYLACAVALFLVMLIKEACNGASFSKVFVQGIKALFALLAGLCLYSLAVPIVLEITSQSLTTAYNGIANVGHFEGISIWELLQKTYRYAFDCLFHPLTHQAALIGILNQILLGIVIASSVYTLWKNKTHAANTVLVIVLLCLFPLGMGCIYVIANEVVHDLMRFSFECFYVLLLSSLQTFPPCHAKLRKWLTRVVAVFLCVIIFQNIIVANQMYLKKQMDEELSVSLVTRIVNRIEETEGFDIGETPVVIVGEFSYNELFYIHSTRESTFGLSGTGINFYPFSYANSLKWYLTYVLNYPLHLEEDQTTIYYHYQLPELEGMPCFPETGCTAMVGDTLVLKISDYPQWHEANIPLF